MALTDLQNTGFIANIPMERGIPIPQPTERKRRGIIENISEMLQRTRDTGDQDSDRILPDKSSNSGSRPSSDTRLGSGEQRRLDSGERRLERRLDSGERRLDSGERCSSSRDSRRSSAGSRRSSGERPSSALARGVQITEFKDLRVNPQPIHLEETDILLEEYLSPRKLRLLTGQDDLDAVKYLEMRVDTRETSLGNFGALLPNMSQLKLSNSIVTSIRDLGSAFNSLRVLWLARSSLEDLDGLSTMSNLEELYLAYNEISDLSQCAMMDRLKILDLEGNNIDDIAQVEFLALCQSLTNLTLEGNPLCLTPTVDQVMPDYDYRQSVKKCIPHLRYLDDEPLITRKDKELKKTPSAFADDWKLIQQLMDEGALESSENLDNPELGIARPVTARPVTGYRPGSALKPNTGTMRRPGTSSRPETASQSTGARQEESPTQEDDGSDLTMGNVVCGNPSIALRSRKKIQTSIPEEPPKLFEQFRYKPEHSFDPILEDAADLGDIVSELKEWRAENDKRIKQIEESRAPQVLKIDYDETIVLSDDSDSESIDSELDSRGPDTRQLDVTQSTDSGVGMSRQSNGSPPPRDSPTSPKPPNELGSRPTSSTSLRSRRFRLPSQENTDIPSRAPTSQSADNIRSDISVTPDYINQRPSSGPVIGTRGKFRLEPAVDKHNLPKNIDKANPVIRVSVRSPEKPNIPTGPRAITSKGILERTGGKPNMRRQLPQVPSLPSRPAMPK